MRECNSQRSVLSSACPIFPFERWQRANRLTSAWHAAPRGGGSVPEPLAPTSHARVGALESEEDSDDRVRECAEGRLRRKSIRTHKLAAGRWTSTARAPRRPRLAVGSVTQSARGSSSVSFRGRNLQDSRTKGFSEKTHLAVEEPKVGRRRLQRSRSHDLVVLRGQVDGARVASIGRSQVERVGQGSDQDLRGITRSS